MTNKIIPFSFNEVRIGDRIYSDDVYKGTIKRCGCLCNHNTKCASPKDYEDEEINHHRIDRRPRYIRLFYPFKIPNDYNPSNNSQV